MTHLPKSAQSMENHSISVCGGQIFKNRTDSEFSQNFEVIDCLKPGAGPHCLRL